MGLFSKKKNSDESDSVLTESEIQKKLYGEFDSGSAHVVPAERGYLKESIPSPALPQVAPPEKEPARDLFSAPKDAWVEPDLPPQNFSEQKPADQATRYVPLHDFEKRSVTPASPVSGTDPLTRFRYNRPPVNRMAAVLDLGKGIFEKAKVLFDTLLDPKRVALRRFFYWGVAALVVFLLFWGVNTLNSQREDAMRARYKMAGKVVPVEVPAVVVSAPVVEREAAIIPAPGSAKKVASPETTGTATVAAGRSYVIQVVTYPNKQDADQIVEALKKAGLRAFVQENARLGGRFYYLVLIGGFRTAADAQEQLLKFRALEVARPFQDSFVRTNRS